MQIVRSPADLPDSIRGGAVSIGNFDGVHCGHARIVSEVIQRAKFFGGPSVVFTFDPHPVRLLRPDRAPPPLTWTDRKAELLAELGVDFLVVYPTDEQLLQWSARDFFRQMVLERLQAKAMVEGPNFFFGHRREGNVAMLHALCREFGVELLIVDPLEVEGQLVSSSRVRRLIEQGDIDAASRLLTNPYRIRGMVTHGANRGTRIGFPTANLSAIDTLLPGVGVYAGRSYFGGRIWNSAIHIGPNPTFAEQALKVEVHLMQFSGSLYGMPLEVDFIGRLRDIHPFASVGELQSQLMKDVARAEERVAAFVRERGDRSDQ